MAIDPPTFLWEIGGRDQVGELVTPAVGEGGGHELGDRAASVYTRVSNQFSVFQAIDQALAAH